MANKEFDQSIHPESDSETKPPEHDFLLDEVGIFILAGGKGSRLKKSDDVDLQTLPKPLVQIDSENGKLTMLDNALYGVFAIGILGAVLLTSDDPESQGDLIENHALTNHKDKVQFVRENQPLGTAGAVFNALQYVEKSIIAIIPADTLFPYESLPQVLQTHQNMATGVTWVVTTSPGENAQNTGRILVDPKNKHVIHALEGQPDIDISLYKDGLTPSTSVGVVIVNREFYLLSYQAFLLENGDVGVVDLYRHFIPWLLEKDISIGTFDIGKPAPDLGTPDRLKQFGRNH